jgi:hypothetical protein
MMIQRSPFWAAVAPARSDNERYLPAPGGSKTVPADVPPPGRGMDGIAPFGFTRAARAALPVALRLKLEQIEADATALHAHATVIADRVRESEGERRSVADRLAALQARPYRVAGQWRPDPAAGPTARRWVPAPDSDPHALEAMLAELDDDIARRRQEREELTSRWQRALRLAERARRHLGLA